MNTIFPTIPGSVEGLIGSLGDRSDDICFLETNDTDTDGHRNTWPLVGIESENTAQCRNFDDNVDRQDSWSPVWWNPLIIAVFLISQYNLL